MSQAVSRTCPRCFKADDEARDNCPDRSVMGCPEPVEVSDTDLVVTCAAPCGGPCGKLLAMPVGNVMKRKQLTQLGVCSFDVCRARLVLPSQAPAPSTPPPITGEVKRGKGK